MKNGDRDGRGNVADFNFHLRLVLKVHPMMSMCWLQAPYAPQRVRVTGIHHGGRFRGRVSTMNAAVREVLTTQQRQKLDSTRDSEFYSLPRFCNHADDHFIRTQRLVYERYLGSLKPGERVTVLDLASSDRSHMPESIVFDTRYTFIRHGMNAEELARNPILDRWFVRDLNADPPSSTSPLAFEDESLDAVVCCCSVQYFQYPEMVFADLRRALKPGGLLLVSFTNKAFWTKALSVWGNSTEYARVQLVKQYLMAAGFSSPTEASVPGQTDPPLLERIRNTVFNTSPDPYYCVLAVKTSD